MPYQPSEPVPDFVEVSGEAVPAAPLPEHFQLGRRPAATFPVPVAPRQLAQDALRAAGGLVVLARRQFVAPQTGVEPERLPLGVEPGGFFPGYLLVLRRVEPTDHPRFPLHDGQPDDEDRPAVLFTSGLLQAVPPFGLVVLVFGLVRAGRAAMAPFAVGAYITAAYWWSSSTSFANPMIDVARTLSDTFAGIAPTSVPMFLLAQVVGGAAAVAAVALLHPTVAAVASEVVVPHGTADDPSHPVSKESS